MNRKLSLLALLLATSLARAEEGGFRFIHASDSHIGGPGGNADIDTRLFHEMSQLNPKPAFVILTGDTVDYGRDDEYALFKKATEALGGVPLHTAPGNHDVRWNPRGKEGYTTFGPGQGRLYTSWDYQNIHFVTLDSTVLLEHWGHISQEELNWLKTDLEKTGPDRPVIIGFHHWVGRPETIQIDNGQALLDLVAPYNVVLWLQGHGHSDIEWNVNGVPAEMIKGLYQGSYNVIDVTPTELKVYKRYLPEPKKGAATQELTRDKSIPDEGGGPATRPVFTIPLKKVVPPQWSAEATLTPDAKSITLTTIPPDVPGVTLAYQLDTEKPIDLSPPATTPQQTGLAASAASSPPPPPTTSPTTPPITTSIPTANLSPGIHTLTVTATLPGSSKPRDKGARPVFQKPITLTIPGVSPTWSTNVGGEVQSRLVRWKATSGAGGGDLLLVSSMGNDLIALEAASGKETWRAHTNGPIFSACTVADSTAYFGSADHFIYAVDATTGSLKWKTQTGASVLAGPAVADVDGGAVVCVGSADTKIYGLDAQTGQIKWTVQGGNLFQSQTATDGHSFFVGGWDNHFRAIDAATGGVNWDLTLGKPNRPNFSPYAPAITAPAVGEGKVFISTNDGILHALIASTGQEAWKIDWKKMGYSSPLYHPPQTGSPNPGTVYCALSDEGKVFSANAQTGQILWTTNTGSVIYDASFTHAGPPPGSTDGEGGVVAIANVDGTLNCLNAQTGTLQWKYRLGPTHLLGSPAGDQTHLYMGSMSGRVVALPIAPPAP